MQEHAGSVETDYSTLVAKSLAFYQAQQSGPLSSNPIPWRSSSGLSDLPLGGWYEGGSKQPNLLDTAAAACR